MRDSERIGLLGIPVRGQATGGRRRWLRRLSRILRFDSRGRERPADAEVARAGNGYRIRIKLRDWWEIAVVE